MTRTQAPDTETSVPKPAEWLGWLGLIPFVIGAVWLWTADEAMRAVALYAQMFYAAAILSFLGGARWGLAIARPGGATWGRLTVAVAPALVAWLALLTPPQIGLGALAAGFVLMASLDLGLARDGEAPAWYPRLRLPLSVIAVASLLASLAYLIVSA